MDDDAFEKHMEMVLTVNAAKTGGGKR